MFGKMSDLKIKCHATPVIKQNALFAGVFFYTISAKIEGSSMFQPHLPPAAYNKKRVFYKESGL